MNDNCLDWWIGRDASPIGKFKIVKYWESWQAPHRLCLLNLLKTFEPFKSVYEVGCYSGPNLRLIKTVYEDTVTLSGSEPCEQAREFANYQLKLNLDKFTLPELTIHPWDIILSCYVLTYVPMSSIIKTIENMVKIANKAVVLLEYFGDSHLIRNDHLIEYQYNYPAIFSKFNWKCQSMTCKETAPLTAMVFVPIC